VLPVGLAVYLLGLSAYLSSRRMMWLDEFFAWGVLTDPSWSHAMHAWLEGADSGGALYYILGHTLLAFTGPSVLVERLFGAALLAGAFALWFRMLRQLFGSRIALIASGALLVSTGFINYLAEVRFYSQLIAALVLAVWLALWGQRKDRSFLSILGLSFLVHGALVSSHLLGIVYSALVLTAILVCTKPKRHIAAAIGIVMSWGLLLFARQPIHVGGSRVAGMHLSPPHWSDLFSVYQSQPTAFYRLNPSLYLLLAVTVLQWLRYREGGWPWQDDARQLFLRISLLLGAVPALFFVESWTAPWPLWVGRYMLPAILGISGLTAFMLEYQSRQEWIRRLSPSGKQLLFAIALLAIAALHVNTVRHQVQRPAFTTAQLQPLEQGLPVVVADEELFFQLRYYASRTVPHVYFLQSFWPRATAEETRNDLMQTIERQGYWQGGLRTREELLGTVQDFLLLEPAQRDADWIAELQRKGWRVARLGSETFQGKRTSILRLTGPKS
jgi:hypothetical protein